MNLSNPANLLIAGVYYVLAGILAFFSVFGVYTLVRYGKSTALTLAASIIYCLFFLTILSVSYKTLQNILL